MLSLHSSITNEIYNLKAHNFSSGFQLRQLIEQKEKMEQNSEFTYLKVMKIIRQSLRRVNGREGVFNAVTLDQRDDFAADRVLIAGRNSENCDGNKVRDEKGKGITKMKSDEVEKKLTDSDLRLWLHDRMRKTGCAC